MASAAAADMHAYDRLNVRTFAKKTRRLKRSCTKRMQLKILLTLTLTQFLFPVAEAELRTNSSLSMLNEYSEQKTCWSKLMSISSSLAK